MKILRRNVPLRVPTLRNFGVFWVLFYIEMHGVSLKWIVLRRDTQSAALFVSGFRFFGTRMVIILFQVSGFKFLEHGWKKLKKSLESFMHLIQCNVPFFLLIWLIWFKLCCGFLEHGWRWFNWYTRVLILWSAKAETDVTDLFWWREGFGVKV